MDAGRGEGRRESLETIRPWRKKTLQIISTEKWRKESEVTPLPQVQVSPRVFFFFHFKLQKKDLLPAGKFSPLKVES